MISRFLDSCLYSFLLMRFNCRCKYLVSSNHTPAAQVHRQLCALQPAQNAVVESTSMVGTILAINLRNTTK